MEKAQLINAQNRVEVYALSNLSPHVVKATDLFICVSDYWCFEEHMCKIIIDNVLPLSTLFKGKVTMQVGVMHTGINIHVLISTDYNGLYFSVLDRNPRGLLNGLT